MPIYWFGLSNLRVQSNQVIILFDLILNEYLKTSIGCFFVKLNYQESC